MARRPTLQMIAERAGVSRGTVDRVINNRSYVKAEVRNRVLAAIEQTGYLSPHELHKNALQGKPTKPIRLGVLLPSDWPGQFRRETLRGIKAAQEQLAEEHVEIIVKECQTDVPHEAVGLLEELRQMGVSGVSLCVRDDFIIVQQVEQLYNIGIPVITFNSDLQDSKRLCFVGQDDQKSGRIAGEIMSKCISFDRRILTVAGNLEFNGHRKRLGGFCQRLRQLAFPNNLFEVVETYNDYAITYRKISEALQKFPDIQAIYMANQSVPGCIDAVKAADKTGKLRIIVHDEDDTTKLYLREGLVDFTISQDLYRQGYLPLVLLQELLQKGKQPALNQTNAMISIICRENLEDI